MKTALDLAMTRAESLELIPKITDPMGRSWKQPRREDILIDATHALMAKADFENLAEYSASMPTGAYEGKMWKRHIGIFDRTFIAAGGIPKWMLVWFGAHPEPNKVSIHFRDILLVDGELPEWRKPNAAAATE